MGGILGKIKKVTGISAPDAGQAFNVVSGVLAGTPEYLVSYHKGREADKFYRGDLDKKTGKVTFKEITADQAKAFAAKGIPLETAQQLQQRAAAANTPASVQNALDVARRVDERLQQSGMVHDTGLDQDNIDLAKKGQKPGAVAATVARTREDVIRELREDLDDLKGLKKKQHPELEKIAEGSNPPITIRQSMIKTIESALDQLEPGASVTAAASAFSSQVINPVAAPAPAAPKPASTNLGNF